MNFLGLIGDIFQPAMNLIDEVHTSDEERLAMKAKMLELQIKAASQAQEYDKQLLEAKATIITAEAKGESWIQRSWRPVMMLWFGFLVGLHWFGLTPDGLSEATINNLFLLVQIGLGGYVVGRSAEKVADRIGKLKND